MGLRNSDNCARPFGWNQSASTLVARSVIFAPAEGTRSFYYTIKQEDLAQSQKTIFNNKINKV